MWCLVSQPNSIVIEVELDPKAKGEECLEKVCICLGIGSESDYFGLKYHSLKAPDVWLNLRNPIEDQGVAGVPPYRFALRVKFWVPPHLLLQETTRNQFYLNARLDLLEGRLKVPDEATASRLVALIAQNESGDLDRKAPPLILYSQWCMVLIGIDTVDKIDVIAEMHNDMRGMNKSASEYWLLKEVATLDGFGEEIFNCRGTLLGIGPHGINVYMENTQTSIPYSAIHNAVSLRRKFQLHYEAEDHKPVVLEVKCDSTVATTEVYRALTEKHAFYSCETVRGVVTTQCIRNLKGAIASLFIDSTRLGKRYVFDIRRTCREVHDNARRAMYKPAEPVPALPVEQEQRPHETCISETSEQLARILDALTCRICMDAAIDTVFFPCAHVVACSSCASRCEKCPLCRAAIQEYKRVYLPTLDCQPTPTTSH